MMMNFHVRSYRFDFSNFISFINFTDRISEISLINFSTQQAKIPPTVKGFDSKVKRHLQKFRQIKLRNETLILPKKIDFTENSKSYSNFGQIKSF